MRAKKNTPTDSLEAPNIISNGAVNLVNGYMTTSSNLASVASTGGGGGGQTYTLQVCIDGNLKSLDVYVAGNPY